MVYAEQIRYADIRLTLLNPSDTVVGNRLVITLGLNGLLTSIGSLLVPSCKFLQLANPSHVRTLNDC